MGKDLPGRARISFMKKEKCASCQNIDVCKTLILPFPNKWRVGLTFDLPLDLLLEQSVLKLSVAQYVGDWHDLWSWPTDLNINRDHLLIKDYLPTKFEASEAKRSWVISCTRYGQSTLPLTLTFDLLTWISIGIIYSSRTIYLPSL